MKSQINDPSKWDGKFPCVMRFILNIEEPELVVLFNSPTTGTVLVGDEHRVGKYESGLINAGESTTWAPCSVTLSSL